MPQPVDPFHSRRKRRTREHVIEDLSENFLERMVLLNGFLLRRPQRDYGVDVTMFHFSDDGQIENGEIRFQLKATDRLKVIKRETVISIPLQTKDLNYWGMETYPVLLIVFDAQTETAYWLHIQDYIERHLGLMIPEQKTVNVHVPIVNKLTLKSIGMFRDLSLRMLQFLRNQTRIPDVTRKPK